METFKNPIELANSMKKMSKRDLTDMVKTPNKFKSVDEVYQWIDTLRPDDLIEELSEDDKADIIDHYMMYIENPDWNW